MKLIYHLDNSWPKKRLFRSGVALLALWIATAGAQPPAPGVRPNTTPARPAVATNSPAGPPAPKFGAVTPAPPPAATLPAFPQFPAATAPPATAPGSQLPIPNLPKPPTVGAADTNAPAGKSPNDLIPPDGLQMSAMDLASAFEIYQEISGRIVVKSGQIPDKGTVTLKVTEPLTRQEAIEILDALFAQNGIDMIPMGEKVVKAVPAAAATVEGAEINHMPGVISAWRTSSSRKSSR